MKYRGEIDGLRALAVVPVILFHAGYEWFGGGFVGVDVFFVISGYLITSILIEDIENDRFSLIYFYERRARRILPALFFMMLISVPFAWQLMLPDQLADFSRSVIAVSVFASNILFWQESDYFAGAAELKPLLHTWSLAVEEQYYLLFPVFLFLAWRLGRERVFWFIALLALISLGLSEWGWRHKPSANFYLAPTRAWELFAGSMAAFVVSKRGIQSSGFLSGLGLTAILFSIFVFDDATPFPSLYTLVPVVGVVLLILFAGCDTFAARLLSVRPIVGVGLISYSAYLWHQPLFAFARIKWPVGATPELLLFLSVLALGIGWLSWKYVEKPFRDRNLVGQKMVFAVAAIGCSGFFAFGMSGHLTNGFWDRLSPTQKEILAFKDTDLVALYQKGTCFLTPEQGADDFSDNCLNNDDTGYFVWGDSHAAALASGMLPTFNGTIQRTASACPPLLDIRVSVRPRPYCESINRENAIFLASRPDRTVVLHANWLMYRLDVVAELRHTVRQLKTMGVEDIIVVGGVPQFHPSLPAVLFRQGVDLSETAESRFRQSWIRDLDQEIQQVALSEGIRFVSPLDLFCDRLDNCKTVIDADGTFVPTIWDYGHLTEAGAIYLAEHLFD